MMNLLGKEKAGSMVFVVLKNLLKYAVGRSMFCGDCNTCLDWRQAVQIEWTAEGAPRSITAVVCGKCWDGKVRASLAKVAAGHDVKAEYIDGRDFNA